MIPDLLMDMGAGLAMWVIGLFPAWDVPAEIAGFDDTVNGFVAPFSGLGVWVPWPLVITCAGIAIAAWVIGLTIKGIRALIAHIPMVGGSG